MSFGGKPRLAENICGSTVRPCLYWTFHTDSPAMPPLLSTALSSRNEPGLTGLCAQGIFHQFHQLLGIKAVFN